MTLQELERAARLLNLQLVTHAPQEPPHPTARSSLGYVTPDRGTPNLARKRLDSLRGREEVEKDRKRLDSLGEGDRLGRAAAGQRRRLDSRSGEEKELERSSQEYYASHPLPPKRTSKYGKYKERKNKNVFLIIL
jgi:hypothetical protein